jgi:hypothetical protein
MILPGTFPLSVTRGILFDGAVLRCADAKVTVDGSLSPDVTGLFVPSGKFDGEELYILEDAPATFLYFNATEGGYVLARILTTGALTDYWSPIVPLTDEPTGTYAPHGANTGTANISDHPVDLTGLIPKAEVKRSSSADVTLDLNPSVTNAAIGEITIPSISSDDTRDFDFKGTFRWDLVLENVAGDRFGPYITGPFVVSDNITQKPT